MESIDLQGVPETMLQTLYARASHTKRPDRKFCDSRAVEIVEQLDYDFSEAEKDAAMSAGVLARTILLDRMVGAFIRENPHGVVVNIACGLDTRFYRLDNGTIRWYNLDLPETIQIRRRFLEENGRVSTIACSAMDEAWAEAVEPSEEKTLVVIEGLVMYLTEADVQDILSIIDRRFTAVEVIMETMNPFIMRHVKERSIAATRAKFTWGIKSGKELEPLASGLTWVEDVSLVEGMKELYPIYRLLGRIAFIRHLSNQLVVLRK